eukprot:5628095-Prymnesium_polylepis.2
MTGEGLCLGRPRQISNIPGPLFGSAVTEHFGPESHNIPREDSSDRSLSSASPKLFGCCTGSGRARATAGAAPKWFRRWLAARVLSISHT